MERFDCSSSSVERRAAPLKRPLTACAVPDILLIHCLLPARMYTDEVLRHAGFSVHAIEPDELREYMQLASLPPYPLVIFSNTVGPQDAAFLGMQLRRHLPYSKILLMCGPDAIPPNQPIFNAILETLRGPAALVREVQRLMTSVNTAGLDPSPTRHSA